MLDLEFVKSGCRVEWTEDPTSLKIFSMQSAFFNLFLHIVNLKVLRTCTSHADILQFHLHKGVKKS